MIFPFPNTSLIVGALCLLIAVVVGAFRHWCIYLWKRTEVVPVAAGGGDETEELRLGAYIPAWKSHKVRMGSWLLVAACSSLGAALGAVLLRGFDSGHGSTYFLEFLFTRWLLSALLGRGLASYTLRKAENLRIDHGQACGGSVRILRGFRCEDEVNLWITVRAERLFGVAGA